MTNAMLRTLCAGAALLLTQAPALALSQTVEVDAHAGADAVTILAADLKSLLDQHQIPALAIAYGDNISALPERDALSAQHADFKAFETSLDNIDKGRLGLCDRITLARMEHLARAARKRAAVGIDYLDARPGEIGDGGIATVENGKAWYRYFLYAWLGDAVEPDALYDMGMRQLAAANQRYEAQKARAPVNTPDDSSGAIDEATIAAAYAERQRIVEKHIDRLFHSDYDIEPVKIKRSPLGEELPAAGYYVADEGTFYYNAFGGAYDVNQADWVFLHEVLPGHHFAFQIAAAHNPCENPFPELLIYAYVEGWGAYVETLGETLGLYQTPGTKLSALEWDMVRSARVALDIGVNYYGWTDEEALDFWRREVSGGEHFAMREIGRVRRWPAQAITYKYGAVVIERTAQRLAEENAEVFDIRRYHDFALRYGDMPLSAFEALSNDIFNSAP